MNAGHKLTEMLGLQNTMNSTVNPEWASAGNNWNRAVFLESAEAIEHLPWKWWKKVVVDEAAVHMELVDIWHFILSLHIEQGAEHYLHEAVDKYSINEPSQDWASLIEVLENVAQAALRKSRDSVLGNFFDALSVAGLSFDRLHQLYVSKNVLNMFRQHNGYKAGTYVKMWNGVEDNKAMEAVLTTIPADTDNLPKALYDALGIEYAKVEK